jgi:hypothetical protein
VFDALEKDTLNFKSPKKSTTNRQAAAEISRKCALVSDVHKQAKGKYWETTLGNRTPFVLLKSVFAVNMRFITRHDYLQ